MGPTARPSQQRKTPVKHRTILRVLILLSRPRLITIIKRQAPVSSTTMSAAKHRADLFTPCALPKSGLFEIRRGKISLHHAKTGYSYPTIRLPHTFSKLAGLPTRIHQTVHDGALAFLVVISPSEKAANTPESSVFTRRRSPVRIGPSPLSFFKSDTLQPSFWALSAGLPDSS